MSTSLLAACALYAVFIAAWCLVRLARAEPPAGYVTLAATLLTAVQALQAVAAAGHLAGGERSGSAPVIAGYLLASVALLPLAAAFAREGDRWDSLALAIGCGALAVVDWRLGVLWAAGA